MNALFQYSALNYYQLRIMVLELRGWNLSVNFADDIVVGDWFDAAITLLFSQMVADRLINYKG